MGYAQSDAPTLPPLVTAPDEPEAPAEPPAGETISRERTLGELPPDNLAPRLLLGPVVGSLGTSGGVILGFILGAIVSGCAPFDGECEPFALIVPGIGLGWIVGSVSVYATSSVFNGQGALWPTMLGGAAGMASGLAALSASGGEAWYAVPLLTAVGAMVGYEISNAFERSGRQPRRDALSGLQVLPVVGPTPEGGILGGLVGRF